jgi:hypothetical protein
VVILPATFENIHKINSVKAVSEIWPTYFEYEAPTAAMT